MIQLRTIVNVADNSGARKLQCFHVKTGHYHRYATVGDVIVASVRDAMPNSAVKKGEVVRAVVVRTAHNRRRPDGSYFADNRKGTAGYLWPLLAVPGERLYFAEGADKEGEPVSGSTVLLFRYHEIQPGILECELHGFVKVDSRMQQLCAILFMPFITSTVDLQLREVVDGPMQVAEKATANPAEVLKLMDSMPSEDATKLEEFRAMLTKPEAKP